MTKKTAILTENVVRRWGKLANMKTLTENFIDQLAEEEEEMEVELSADDAEVEVEDEMEMDGEAEVEVEAEVSLSEPEVAMIVQGIADKLGELTGAEIEVETSEEAELEADAEDHMRDAAEDMMDAEDDLEDAEANRTDERKGSWRKGGDNNPSGKKDDGSSAGDEGAGSHSDDTDYSGHGMRKGDKSATDPGDEDDTWREGGDSKTHPGRKNRNRKDETLNIELVDEEQITEAVLARVIERLIKNNK